MANANDQNVERLMDEQERRTEEQQREEERKERERQDRDMALRVGLGIAGSLFTRQAQVKDSATRAMLFVDKLLLFLDASLPFMSALDKRYNFPTDIVSSIEVVQKSVRAEMQHLMRWIQHPQYAPNHPYGQKVMQKAKRNYVKVKQQQSGSTADPDATSTQTCVHDV